MRRIATLLNAILVLALVWCIGAAALRAVDLKAERIEARQVRDLHAYCTALKVQGKILKFNQAGCKKGKA